MRQLSLAPASVLRPQALLPLMIALLCSCARGPTPLIAVSGLPPDADHLEVLISLDGQDAAERPSFDLRGLTINDKTGYRFGLRLPEESAGELALGVAALDARGCLLAVGDARLPVADVSTERDISVVLRVLAKEERARCVEKAPFTRALYYNPENPDADTSAVSSSTPAGARSLRGWGFGRGVTVGLVPLLESEASSCMQDRCPTAAPEIVPDATRLSPTELRFTLREPKNASGRDTLCLIVQNTDGRRTCQLTASYRYPLLPTSYLVGSTLHPNALVIEDLDGDGRKDLAFSAQDVPEQLAQPTAGVVAVMRNLGEGRFAAPEILLRSEAASALVSGQLDGDQRPDLVFSNRVTGTVTVLHNDGAGRFPMAAQRSYAAGVRPDSIAVADLNRDGLMDLAVVNDPFAVAEPTSNVAVLLSQAGEPRFAPAVLYVGGTAIGFVQAADLDGDGWNDLAVSGLRIVLDEVTRKVTRVSGGVTLLRNNGAGGFPMLTSDDGYKSMNDHTAVSTALLSGLLVENIEGEGGDTRPELLVSGQSSNAMGEGNQISVLRFQQVNGEVIRYNDPVDYPAGKAPFGMGSINLNSDGHRDLAISNVGNSVSGRLVLLLSQPPAAGGEFAKNDLASYPAGLGSGAVAVGDLDNDGREDVAVAFLGQNDEAERRLLSPGSVTVYLNRAR